MDRDLLPFSPLLLPQTIDHHPTVIKPMPPPSDELLPSLFG